MNRQFEEHIAQPAIQPGTSITTAVPAREANIRSDVVVPLLQAALTGAFVASLFVLALTELMPEFGGDLLKIWGAAALVVMAIAWMILLGQHRKLLWAVERLTNTDLDGDSHKGEPPPPPTVRVEVAQEKPTGNSEFYIDLPGHPGDLAILAKGVLNGRAFSEAAWCGASGLFSKGDFIKIRDALIERGLAVWRNPKARAQGVELSAAGRAVFRRLAQLEE